METPLLARRSNVQSVNELPKLPGRPLSPSSFAPSALVSSQGTLANLAAKRTVLGLYLYFARTSLMLKSVCAGPVTVSVDSSAALSPSRSAPSSIL